MNLPFVEKLKCENKVKVDTQISTLAKMATDLLMDYLNHHGYIAERNGRESDLVIGKTAASPLYFEIKATRKKEYFGAASFTEWQKAYSNPNNYKFVIAYYSNDSFTYTYYTPDEFEKCSVVPPFKIYFMIDTETGKSLISETTKSTKLSKEVFKDLSVCSEIIKNK